MTLPPFTDNTAFGLATPAFDAATSWTGEVGAKLWAMDVRLELNLAAYANDVDSQAFGVCVATIKVRTARQTR